MENIEYVLPGEIEKRSFAIIGEELKERGIVLPPEQEPVTKRVIHTSADFDYAKTMTYSPHAVQIAKELIAGGADIVTDTNMALAGINKKRLADFGGPVHCFMADEDVAREAKTRQVTRATVSMEHAAHIDKPVIFAVGNAPTALISLYELMQKSDWRPAFIIGVPVGFVNVEAAKELILKTDVPHIVNRGRKGGSNVAAAIVNALLYQIRPVERKEGGVSGVRYGFTTGSCAAAAAKAAAYMLLTGKIKNCITIETPKGIPYTAEVTDIVRGESQVSCAVVKDGGDDPDVTSGSKICATVTADNRGDGEKELLQIDGGKGVGRVTRPGLDQPVGNAAINHVPREMITREVQEVCRICDFHGTLHILISVPDGEALAERTFNPRLGIVGGISILGTTGIVEPMSSQALKETIRVELRQQRAEGQTIAAVSPGNYGLDFMQQTYGYDLDRSVKCSNFIGETIDMAAELGFCAMLLTGHIGKLIKVAGGIMNTHSHEGDCRMELLAAAGIRENVSLECLKKILDCVTTEEALAFIDAEGKKEDVMEDIMKKIDFYLKKRAAGRLQIECIVYYNAYGLLGMTGKAEELLRRLL